MFKKLIPHLVFLSLLLFIMFFPLYWQSLHTPENRFFSFLNGIHEDFYYDLSVIRQGRTSFFEIDQYTTENVQSSQVHLYYLLLGRLARLFGLTDTVVYFVGIVCAFLLYYFSSFYLISHIFKGKYMWLTMIISFFGSPFLVNSGWTKTSVYDRLIYLPHHFTGIAFSVFATYHIVKYFETKKLKHCSYGGIALVIGIVLYAVPGLIVLTSLVTLYVLKTVRLLFQRRLGRKLMTKKNLIFLGYFLLLPILGLILIQYQIAQLGFPWAHFLQWEYITYQIEEAPYLFSVFVASYWMVLIYSLLALPLFLKKSKSSHQLLVLIVVMPFIFYLLSVFGFIKIAKIRFIYNALYLYCSILGTWGLQNIIQKCMKQKQKELLFWAVFFIFLLTGTTNLYDTWVPEINRNMMYENIYINKAYKSLFKYINENTKPMANFLTTFETGVFIPAYTHARVYVGHEVNTYKFWNKWGHTQRFFYEDISAEAGLETVQRENIDYVLWDVEGIPKKYETFLSPVYHIQGITLYNVKK